MRSRPLLSSVTFHLPPPCVVRAVALRPSCSSSSPAEYWNLAGDPACGVDMVLMTDFGTGLNDRKLVGRSMNSVAEDIGRTDRGLVVMKKLGKGRLGR